MQLLPHYEDFNSTKVQFGGFVMVKEPREEVISIPLRYNLEPLPSGKPRPNLHFNSTKVQFGGLFWTSQYREDNRFQFH